jgi:hypothetical protein
MLLTGSPERCARLVPIASTAWSQLSDSIEDKNRGEAYLSRNKWNTCAVNRSNAAHVGSQIDASEAVAKKGFHIGAS